MTSKVGEPNSGADSTIEHTEEIDISLVEFYLRLTPEERLIAHDNALKLVLTLQEAGRKYYANRLKPTP